MEPVPVEMQPACESAESSVLDATGLPTTAGSLQLEPGPIALCSVPVPVDNALSLPHTRRPWII